MASATKCELAGDVGEGVGEWSEEVEPARLLRGKLRRCVDKGDGAVVTAEGEGGKMVTPNIESVHHRRNLFHARVLVALGWAELAAGEGNDARDAVLILLEHAAARKVEGML